MKKNEILTLPVTGMTSEGHGVAKTEGPVVFIPGAIAGETVEAKILKVKKNIAYAKIEKVVIRSADRIIPCCERYSSCGGCTYLHIAYQKQLEIKKQKVIDTLARIGNIDVPVHDTLPSPEQFHYRNKALIPVGKDISGKIITGFYSPRTHLINDIDSCLIQHEKADKVIYAVKQWMEKNNIEAYNEETHKGVIRHIYFRIGAAYGEIMAGVVANAKKLPHSEELSTELMKIPGVTSVIHNVNCQKTNVILGDKTHILSGKSYITDKILDTEFKIGPLSFYQVNPYQTSRLYQSAIDSLQLESEDVLFDIYCGIGTIGLCAAKKIKKLIGVEIIPEAISYANENAKINQFEHCEFYVGKAEAVIYDLIKKKGIPTAIVLDPPRSGCDQKLLDAVISLYPKKLCYVSCDVATLARDLKYLKERASYNITSVTPVDMFPQTSHVECCVSLLKTDK